MEMKVKYLISPNNRCKQFAYRRTIPQDLKIYYPNKSNHYHFLGTDRDRAIQEAEKLTRQYDSEYAKHRGNNDPIERKAHKEAAKYGLKLEPQPRMVMTHDYGTGSFESIENNPDHQRFLDDMEWLYEYHEEGSDGYIRKFHEPAPHHQLMEDIFAGRLKHSLKVVEEFTLANISSDRKRVAASRLFKEFTPFTDTKSITKVKTEHFKKYIEHLSNKGLTPETIRAYVGSLIGYLKKYWKDKSKSGKEPPNWSTSLKYIKKAKKEDSTPKVIHPEHLEPLDTFLRSKMARFLNSQLTALLMNTGCRVNEIAGLKVKDVHISEKVPYIKITDNEARTLKTIPSDRLVPLVGISYDAMLYALEGKDKDGYLFPSLIKTNSQGLLEINNSPSSMVGTLLKKFSPEYSSHSFRHTLTARMRLAGFYDQDFHKFMGWAHDGKTRQSDAYGNIADLQKAKEIIERALAVTEYQVL